MGLSQPGGVLTGKPVTERSIPPLRLLSETKVEESTSCPEPPQPDPAQEVSGFHSHPSPCWIQCWRKTWCFFVRKIPSFPYPNSWGTCFSIMSLPGSFFLWVHLAPTRKKPVAAPPGQGQPGAAASQPELIKGV